VHSAEHLHLLIEMTKLAYADRDRWVADPARASLPVAALLDKAYAARRRKAFDPAKAQAYQWGDPDGDTTGFVVADGQGNVLSVIQSIYKSFGSTVVPPGTGVVLQNRGGYFNTDPAHPNCFAPRKRPFHTLLACVVTRDDRPVLGYATMGGDGQAMFHTQVLTNVLDYGMEVQEAIERPRFVCGPLDPGDVRDTVRIEARVPAEIRTRSSAGVTRSRWCPTGSPAWAWPGHHAPRRYAQGRRRPPRRRRRDRLLMLRALTFLGMLLAAPGVAGAGEWGNIEPGVSTVEQVRARYGAPSKETRARVEGYDTLQWVYESNRAPGGLVRMTVDFGLLAQTGFKPSVVRLLKLEPKPLIFGRRTVIEGWGLPDGVGDQDGVRTFFTRRGSSSFRQGGRERRGHDLLDPPAG
jgi:hypothetical protein